MQGSERATPPPKAAPPKAVPFEPSLSARARIADATWSVLHVLGAHRWREGYEIDLERGWSRYRGSRCTVCDSPWEGW